MNTLPFLTTALVKDQAGDVLIDAMPISLWPAQGHGVTLSGMAYDHDAEAPLTAYDALDGGNTRLEVDGERYVVIERERQQFIPHVSLRLRRVTARG